MNCFKDFDDSLIIVGFIKKNGKIVKRQNLDSNSTFGEINMSGIYLEISTISADGSLVSDSQWCARACSTAQYQFRRAD